MERGDRKVLSDRNTQRNSLPRRNLFTRKSRAPGNQSDGVAAQRLRSRSRSRSRPRSRRQHQDNENQHRPVTRYRPNRILRSSDAESSPSKKSSPVKERLTKSWADIIEDGDEDLLWQELTPESLDQQDRQRAAKAESQASASGRSDEPATPRSSFRKMTVEELLDTPSASSSVEPCFKAPITGSRVSRSGRHSGSGGSSSSGRRYGPGGRNGAQSRNERRPADMETSVDVLKRRQKDLDYGKNTIGYQNYADLVPKDQRKRGQPVTPDKFSKMARRSWDNLIKMWRIKLHAYDPTNDGDDQEVELSDILSDMSFDSKITFGDFSSPVSSAFPPSSPVSFLTFDDCPPLSSEGNLTDPDYDPALDKDSDLLADMDESDFLS